MRKLILLSALPGAGKSTWANNYKRLNSNELVYIVSSDEIRKELGGSYQYFKEEEKVWRLFLERANSYAKENENVTVILDSTNLTNHYREMYFHQTPGFDRHVLVYIECDYQLACVRNLQRAEEKIVPQFAMEKLNKELEMVDEKTSSLYDEYIVYKVA